MYGNMEICSYSKDDKICQIPGIVYKSEPLLNVSRPIEWEGDVFSKAQHHSINIKKHDET